ncbi:hypothetical protein VM1G_11409 [Cytospora mali]|uniref:Uncharacterized protein n=1 Tax=Cytospora mali TaxID=578113 RepID=A0A194VS87_CYTMA|nr:hypothetical protein VM1G_11409 [Valsa mali]
MSTQLKPEMTAGGWRLDPSGHLKSHITMERRAEQGAGLPNCHYHPYMGRRAKGQPHRRRPPPMYLLLHETHETEA